MHAIQTRKISSFSRLTPEQVESTRFGGRAQELAFAPERAPNLFDGGSWSIGPFTIHWEVKGDKEVDVDVYLFGYRLAELSGTLSGDGASLAAEIDALAVKGVLKITAQWSGSDAGLWAEGDLAAFGHHYHFKERIFSW